MAWHEGIPDWSPLKQGVLITGRAQQTTSSQKQTAQDERPSPPEQTKDIANELALENKMENHINCETDEADAGGERGDRCPYCGSNDSCEHLLLSVDCTFRGAVGGALYESFNSGWSNVLDENEDDEKFDEGEAFDDLLDAATGKSDFEWTNEFEGGPGQSSTYRSFYCKDKELVAKVVEDWQSGKG